MLDILIVGSGPAGMTAAIYAKRAGKEVAILEKEFYGTGQMALSSRIDNYPGIGPIGGFELGEQFREQAENFGVEFLEGKAVGFEKEADGWKTLLSEGEAIKSKTIIYAAGASHKMLSVPGEEALLGKGISFCASCDGAFYEKKTVAVIGGGDTAVDDALYLSKLCKKVYLVHRRDIFRAAPSHVARLKEKENVEFLLSVEVKEILGKGKVEAILLSNGIEVKTDGVFVAIGMKPRTQVLSGVVALDEKGYVIAGEDCKSSAEGFYVAGDVRTKVLRQVITAAADGAVAATAAAAY